MKLKKAAFYGLLIVGVGFCIGGVFFAPLLPVGIACISGAVAVAQNLSQQAQSQPQSIHLANPETNPSEIDIRVPRSDDSLEVDLHIEHRQHHSFRRPKTFPEPDESKDIETDHNAKASPHKGHHKRHP